MVSEFQRRLDTDTAKHLKGLIVFGSRATGCAEADSDLDLMALVDKKTVALEARLDDIAYAVMWDSDFQPVISLKVLEESKFNDAVKRGFSFYRNVLDEGIAV